ncbi:MAG: PTS sugar transporter [Deltaproteobacteria bacterium]|nr:PTS sugar transporter [Deltaproteobacteria bacterium]
MIGLLIVTHCDLGKEFLNAAEFIVGSVEAVEVISITQTQTSDSEKIRKMIEDKITVLNKGDGIIILTDMFGGTPSNLSLSFLKEEKVEVLTGVNLPMVIAIIQHRSNLGLSELAETAQEAGKASISLAGKLLK